MAPILSARTLGTREKGILPSFSISLFLRGRGDSYSRGERDQSILLGCPMSNGPCSMSILPALQVGDGCEGKEEEGGERQLGWSKRIRDNSP